MTGHHWEDGIFVDAYCTRCGLSRTQYLARPIATLGDPSWTPPPPLYEWRVGDGRVDEDPGCLGPRIEQLTDAQAEIFVRLLDDGCLPPRALDLAEVVV